MGEFRRVLKGLAGGEALLFLCVFTISSFCKKNLRGAEKICYVEV